MDNLPKTVETTQERKSRLTKFLLYNYAEIELTHMRRIIKMMTDEIEKYDDNCFLNGYTNGLKKIVKNLSNHDEKINYRLILKLLDISPYEATKLILKIICEFQPVENRKLKSSFLYLVKDNIHIPAYMWNEFILRNKFGKHCINEVANIAGYFQFE